MGDPLTGYPFKVWHGKDFQFTVYFDEGKVQEITLPREGPSPPKGPKAQ